MAKLCPKGKAAAKRKFKVYPSDFKGPKKAMGGVIDFNKISQDRKKVSSFAQGGIAKGCGAVMQKRRKKTKKS